VIRGRSGARVEAGPIRVTSFRPEVSDLAGREVIVGIRPTDLDRPAPATGSLLRLRADPAHIHLFALDGPALAHGV
jgi:hypothetical protein